MPGSLLQKENILADLQKIYQLGYFEGDSLKATPYLKDDQSILLEYSLVEAPPINDLVIYGNNNSEINAYDIFVDLIAKPENAKLIKEKIQELESEYLKKGFIVAKVADINITQAGSLEVFVDEGYINRIVFKGNEKTKESYLKNVVRNQKTNSAYNEFEFSKDYKRLQGTNFFSSITRTVRPSENSSGYDLVIEMTEKRTASASIGGGINSTAGVFANANLNIANIRGKGENLNITAIIGSGYGATQSFRNNSDFVRRGNLTQISTSYSIPYFRDTDMTFNTFANFTQGVNYNVDLADQTSYGVGAGISKVYDGKHVFRLSGTANYIDLKDRDRKTFINELTKNIIKEDALTQEDILKKKGDDFLGGKDKIARDEAKAIRDSQIVSGMYFGLRPSYSFSDLDDPQNPRDGWLTKINAEPTLGFAGVSSFTKLSASATKYLPLGEESSFLLNMRGGSTVFGELPQFASYRLGSASGVRGYRQFAELGYGSDLAITTAEFRTPIYKVISPLKRYKFSKNVDFALFADAGLVANSVRYNRITDRLSQAAAIGFGIRVKLPLVGALRFDMGFPLIKAISPDQKLFRFNFGPANMF